MRIKYQTSDLDLLGRIMRAEAVGEGVFGMKLVGNVIVNRVAITCSEFKNKKTIYQVVYQKNQFEGIKISLFNARATKKEKELAYSCIKFWRAYPAYKALYFQNPGKNKACKKKFWGILEGRFKNHCFYNLSSYKGCSI